MYFLVYKLCLHCCIGLPFDKVSCNAGTAQCCIRTCGVLPLGSTLQPGPCSLATSAETVVVAAVSVKGAAVAGVAARKGHPLLLVLCPRSAAACTFGVSCLLQGLGRATAAFIGCESRAWGRLDRVGSLCCSIFGNTGGRTAQNCTAALDRKG
jgi:hypothetical protein